MKHWFTIYKKFLGPLTKQRESEFIALIEDLDLIPAEFVTPEILKIWRAQMSLGQMSEFTDKNVLQREYMQFFFFRSKARKNSKLLKNERMNGITVIREEPVLFADDVS